MIATSAVLKINGLFTRARRRMMAKTYWGFSQIYLVTRLATRQDYVPSPPFHKQMIEWLGNYSCDMLEILGFRSSAKTFYGTLGLPLHAALEFPDKYQFIIIVGDTQAQALQFIAAIKDELETNDLLIRDYGVDDGKGGKTLIGTRKWGATSIILPNGVMILARSRGQKVRGLKHGYFRPKMVVVDDPEDIEHVKTQENRDKSEKWFVGEVLPAMAAFGTRVVLIGNLLHEDALLARMKSRMQKVLEFPLAGDYKGTDYEGIAKHCLWHGLYPTAESVRRQAEKVGAEAFSREFLMRIMPAADQIIRPEDIHYYDVIPESFVDGNGVEHIIESAGFVGHGMDCALSQKQTADFTAMVDGEAFFFKTDGGAKLYVKPRPFNQRMRLHDLIQHMKKVDSDGQSHLFFVESNNVGEAVVQEMERELLAVEAMVASKDKRTRLEVVAPYIRSGIVVFPRTGCEEMLQQVFALGSEKHDDLNDALVWLIWGMVKMHGLDLPKIGVVEM